MLHQLAAKTEPNPPSATAKQEIPLDAILVIGGFILVLIVELLAILVLNDGKFTYTLDDTYIHLAVAEEISAGRYGVNASEFSAPCSSPLFPFLLAPLARTAAGQFMPLAMNAVIGIVTCLMVLREARRVIPSGSGSSSDLARVAVSLAILLGCNIVGLVFSGMEHNLQVLLALIVAGGIIHIARTGNAGWPFVLAAVCGPLIRYENLALTAVACCVLLAKRRPVKAVLIGGLALAGLGLFSGFLTANGLPPIPSSIMAKSHLAGGASRLSGTLHAWQNSFVDSRGVIMLLLTAALVAFAVRKNAGPVRLAALALAGAGLLHACFGAYGWYNRYECYIFAALMFGLLSLAADPEVGIVGHWNRATTTLVSLIGLVISYPYLVGLFSIPLASNNIYEQQFQMHRFTTGWWKKPVAVNDLGWVSYRNDNHVLDLWGLGSHEALKARLEKRDPSWMAEMAEKHGVGLAMVYEDAVPARSAGWIKVGEIRLSRPRITPHSSKVAFFATHPSFVSEIDDGLQDFRKSVPPGVTVVTRSDMEK